MVAEGDVLRFVRLGGGKQVLVVANLGEGTVEAGLPQGAWEVAEPALSAPVPPGARLVKLGPWELCLLGAPA